MNIRGIPVLTGADVGRLLTMPDCLAAMEAAFRALAQDEALQPLRQVLTLPSGDGALYVMPAFLGDDEPALAVKLVSLFPRNADTRYETHQGAVVLFGARHGEVLALMEAGSVTALRTAAVSALATRLLAVPQASELAILGAGVQARSHLAAMRAVRPIRRVRVWSRNAEHALAFAREMQALHGVAVEAQPNVQLAVLGADVICTVTGAQEPVLPGEWVAPGAHINAVGASTPAARELDTEAVARAAVFVDSRAAALAEAGDILIPIAEGVVGADHIRGELAELVTGRVVGRENGHQVTLFKSLGLAIEDAAAARLLHRKAVAEGMRVVDFG